MALTRALVRATTRASLLAAPARTFIYRTLQDLEASGQVVEAKTKTWVSRRYTLRKDGMGFSFHWTTLKEGMSQGGGLGTRRLRPRDAQARPP